MIDIYLAFGVIRALIWMRNSEKQLAEGLVSLFTTMIVFALCVLFWPIMIILDIYHYINKPL